MSRQGSGEQTHAGWSRDKLSLHLCMSPVCRACDTEITKVRTDVRVALEAMLQHRLHVHQVLKETLASVQQSQQRLLDV